MKLLTLGNTEKKYFRLLSLNRNFMPRMKWLSLGILKKIFSSALA
jgi:hypothetical protein